jgi:hypothetical protein
MNSVARKSSNIPVFRVPTIEEIRKAEEKRLVIRMLSVFGDDSTDEKKERVFAVAGVAGTQEEWRELKVKWLEKTKGVIFHATDCESDQEDFAQNLHEENKRLYKDLIRLLIDSKMFGYGAAIDLDGYNEYLRDPDNDSPYFYCFINVAIYFVKFARLIIPKQQVQFVFDVNHTVQYNAAFIYEKLMVNRSEYSAYTSDMDKQLGFATRDEVGIQVADLFTFETMKNLDNRIGPTKRSTRISFEKLRNTKRFKIITLGESYFRDFRVRNEHRLQAEKDNYNLWRSKYDYPDTTLIQFRYLMYRDSTKKLQ